MKMHAGIADKLCQRDLKQLSEICPLYAYGVSLYITSLAKLSFLEVPKRYFNMKFMNYQQINDLFNKVTQSVADIVWAAKAAQIP